MVPHVFFRKVTRHRDWTVSVWLCKTLLKEHKAVGEHRKSQDPGHPCETCRVLSRSNRLRRDVFAFLGM